MLGTAARSTRIARTLGETLFAYVRLTKPRIVGLLVVTTLPAMILAERGMPSGWLILATVLGGSIVAGGANAMNMYFDRDIDALMVRTRGRPVPSGQVEPEKAFLFGLLLAAVGFLLLQTFANLLAASLTIGALLFYIVVYTLLLKRSTPLNIVIGGAAGAAPPMIGWAAVTGEIAVPALIMFAIVTAWTPPHFWALSLNYSSDYERAGVPMLPVVSGKDETKRQILLYSVLLVAITMLLPIWSAAGVIYAAAAAVLGAGFLYYAYQVYRDFSASSSVALFRYSLVYLALLFGAIAADGLIAA
ncbi:MAG: protoheme IX farnesyltransferase [Chloroflexi bacterium]|nr:protoheme IX farnesyltransferase [Chloroflexota bacterium]